ncbi:glycosyltransferase family 2 protein [Oligella urethralis]|uniref:glycosyltransferase family 2 protein n=1 Tax=Oligella urethralis TaxID=90245 RepID=UPI0024309B54|nr:glycosyltransferase family 2 protein [Oligella urethralis]
MFVKKYSIIVPVFNVQEYVLSCLRSIQIAMTDGCECLVINDGSTDESAIIAEKFCTEDDRFIMLNKVNGGQSDARNYGLNRAKGEYIVFVDSDDIVSPYLFQALDRAIDLHKSDLIYMEHIKFSDCSKESELFRNQSTIKDELFSLMTNKELAREHNYPWARVAKANLYENNRFPVGLIYEDAVTSTYLSQYSNTITRVSLALYGYRRRAGSLTTVSQRDGLMDVKRQFRLFEAVVCLKQRLIKQELSEVYVTSTVVNLIKSCLVSLARIDDKETKKMYSNKIQNEYYWFSQKAILSSYSLLHYKILALLSRNKLSLFFLDKIITLFVRISDRKSNL